ncbi:MAG: hypothetical protein D4S01_03100 [Dehalococcoidia bacterium]|nr:MAG: hypothetical protein D4S01_03100 [Dehalococcoidia bacterium]
MNYLTPAEAEEIANERLNVEAWDDAVDEDGSNFGEVGTLTYKSLTMATKIIDRLNYAGEKYDEDQVNQFPRGEDTTVPDDIGQACFEIALALLDGVDPQLEGENLGMTSQGYANVRSTYDRGIPAPHLVAGVPSLTAWRYLIPYLRDVYLIDINRTS